MKYIVPLFIPIWLCGMEESLRIIYEKCNELPNELKVEVGYHARPSYAIEIPDSLKQVISNSCSWRLLAGISVNGRLLKTESVILNQKEIVEQKLKDLYTRRLDKDPVALKEKRRNSVWLNRAMPTDKDMRLVIGYEDGKVQVWNVYNNKIINLDGHSKKVDKAVFALNGGRLATYSNAEERCIVWDKVGNILLYFHTILTSGDILLSYSGRLLARKCIFLDAYYNYADFFDVNEKKITHQEMLPRKNSFIALSSGGDAYALETENCVIKIVNLLTEESILLAQVEDILQSKKCKIVSCIFSQNDTQLVVIFDNYQVKVWDIIKKKVIQILNLADNDTNRLMEENIIPLMNDRILITSSHGGMKVIKKVERKNYFCQDPIKKMLLYKLLYDKCFIYKKIHNVFKEFVHSCYEKSPNNSQLLVQSLEKSKDTLFLWNDYQGEYWFKRFKKLVYDKGNAEAKQELSFSIPHNNEQLNLEKFYKK